VSPDLEREVQPAEWTDCLPPAPETGTNVQTACGGVVEYSASTPCVMYQGKRIYFCLPLCKAVLESDPRHSCLTLYNSR
jgi:YHS domain-containing protein